MKIILCVLAALCLTGCAELAPGLKTAANGINKGVARSPDATVNVNVNQQ